jgi:hypothetical protein
MSGDMDFEVALRERVRLLAGFRWRRSMPPPSGSSSRPGRERSWRRSSDWECGSASCPADSPCSRIGCSEQLDLDHAEANELEVVDGAITGELVGRIVDRRRKAEILRELVKSTASRSSRPSRSATEPTTWICWRPPDWGSRSMPSRWCATRPTPPSTSPISTRPSSFSASPVKTSPAPTTPRGAANTGFRSTVAVSARPRFASEGGFRHPADPTRRRYRFAGVVVSGGAAELLESCARSARRRRSLPRRVARPRGGNERFAFDGRQRGRSVCDVRPESPFIRLPVGARRPSGPGRIEAEGAVRSIGAGVRRFDRLRRGRFHDRVDLGEDDPGSDHSSVSARGCDESRRWPPDSRDAGRRYVVCGRTTGACRAPSARCRPGSIRSQGRWPTRLSPSRWGRIRRRPRRSMATSQDRLLWWILSRLGVCGHRPSRRDAHRRDPVRHRMAAGRQGRVVARGASAQCRGGGSATGGVGPGRVACRPRSLHRS